MTGDQGTPDTVLDLFLDVLIERPDRINWTRPAPLYPLLVDCAHALEKVGYTTTTGVVRGVAYLTARRHPQDTP